MTLMLPSPASADRDRVLAVDKLRREALERLYRRRETVEGLIRSLEDYQRTNKGTAPKCREFSARRKCS